MPLHSKWVVSPCPGGVQGNDAETIRFKAAAANSMGDINEQGDAPFGGEVQMESKVYWWHEKYRPRKPKYYNRVHTGYEWNKYNQTHYDHDNPPPKVKQSCTFLPSLPDGNKCRRARSASLTVIRWAV